MQLKILLGLFLVLTAHISHAYYGWGRPYGYRGRVIIAAPIVPEETVVYDQPYYNAYPEVTPGPTYQAPSYIALIASAPKNPLCSNGAYHKFAGSVIQEEGSQIFTLQATNFLNKLQGELIRGDSEAFAELISYPLRVNDAAGNHQYFYNTISHY